MAETLKQFKQRVAEAVMEWDRGDGCKEEFLAELGLQVPNPEVNVVATVTFLTEGRAFKGLSTNGDRVESAESAIQRCLHDYLGEYLNEMGYYPSVGVKATVKPTGK